MKKKPKYQQQEEIGSDMEMDTGNLVDDPLYNALDELYSRGWKDRNKERNHDPRGTTQWMDVLALFRMQKRKMENSIEKEVLDWHKATFPNATADAVWKKLQEEAIELIASFRYGTVSTEDEIADVCIVAIRLLDFHGMSLSRVIGHKLEINKNRKWGQETPNGDRPRIKQENAKTAPPLNADD